MVPRRARAALLLALLGLLASLVSACSLGTQSGDEPEDAATVVVATHDSWAAPKPLLRRFEQETGYHLRVLTSGDAGQLTNKLVLTKDHPIADAVFGIDNTFASRALDEDVLAAYRSKDLPPGPHDLTDGGDRLTPVDWGDVCVNVDDRWFASHQRPEPTSLEDLTEPEYRNLFVTPGAASSSPGFAFLLTTVAAYGEDGWQDYWRRLMANGAKLTSGWTDAYEVDFTAGGGGGDRPIVLSYNSSPPFTIPDGRKRPTTSALLDTCFRQVEYAGVLAGAANPRGAQAFVDFLVSRPFQEALPESMYVFPVSEQAALPPAWARWAPPAPHPFALAPGTVAAKRSAWLTEWSDITSG